MTLLSEGLDNHQENGSEFIIAIGEVVNTVDLTGCGRVQIRVPWLPETQPWARVAVPGAGNGRGTYIIPHEGDEVLIGLNRKDESDAFVIGSLWNMSDPPPRRSPLDPTTKIAIRSEAGHDLEFDDVAQTIAIETSTGQRIELAPDGIKLTTTGETASITIGTAGDVTIEATTTLTLRAQRIEIEGTGQVQIESQGNVSVNGGANCRVQAQTILLN